MKRTRVAMPLCAGTTPVTRSGGAPVSVKRTAIDRTPQRSALCSHNSQSYRSAPYIPSTLHQLISLQYFDGSWPLEPLLKFLHLSANETATSAPQHASNTDGPKAERMWATTLAIKYLEIGMAHEKEAWELLVQKAKTWLERVYDGDFSAKDAWEQMAERLIGEM